VIWKVVEKRLASPDFEQQSINYLLYGMTAETFGRRTGFNRLGGSMHRSSRRSGSIRTTPSSAARRRWPPALPSTTGFRFSQVWWSPASAMLPRAPVQSGSPSTSPPWRSSRRSGSRAPRRTVVFFVVNNFYGMGRQTIGETMAYERLARIGAGINPENMHAQTIDGNNPLAVIDAMIMARDIDGGDGPVLIDCQTYRLSGHSPSDASSYRTKDELIFGRQRIRSLPTSIGLYRAA
jgi:2-oxoisovalerate dehydrogenase E1 component